MTEIIGGMTPGIVGYALDGLSLRQATIASNIANHQSPGYRPLEVSFERELSDWLSLHSSQSIDEPTIQEIGSPSVTLSQTLMPAQSSLEMQTVMLSQTVLQYQSLVSGLGKYMSIVSTAINEGKK